MPLQHDSEIFEAYIKIAQEQGLVSQADDEYETPKRSTEYEDAIQLLYGIKPEDYKYNIVEKAHPETAVVFPAHDLMNGVLENQNQRQDIMAEIALRNPDGNFIRTRYVAAYEDLAKSIVRAGFKLDSNDDELMKLADSCAATLEKKAAFPILAPALMYGIPAILGLIAFVNNTSNSRQSVIANAQQAVSELTDLHGKVPVDHMIERIQNLISAAVSFESIKIQTFSQQGIIQAAKDNKEHLKGAQGYRKGLMEVNAAIPNFITQLETFQPQEEAEWDWLQKLKDVARSIVPSDQMDSVNALQGLQKAIIADMKAANLVIAQAQQGAIKAQEEAAEEPSQETPAQEAQEQEEPSEIDSINQNYDSIMKTLGV